MDFNHFRKTGNIKPRNSLRSNPIALNHETFR